MKRKSRPKHSAKPSQGKRDPVAALFASGQERRVYGAEVDALFGWNKRWRATQIELGKFPRGRHDPGSRRLWWLKSEVDAVFNRMTAEAMMEPVLSPSKAAAAAHARKAAKTEAS